MKRILLIVVTFYSFTAHTQIATQGNNGSIVITPKGLQGKSNSSTDTSNVALGPSALRQNVTGYSNTAIGAGALRSNQQGYRNTAVGSYALYTATTSESYDNTAIGSYALYACDEGGENTAIGSYALYFGGYFNTATGASALKNNRGGSNTAHGYYALNSNTYGSANTANGALALDSNMGGNSNTANGYQSLYKNTEGSGNTAHGNSAGSNNITGSNNTFIGNFANVTVAGSNLTNVTAIGNGATVNTSNKIRLGNSAVTVIEGQVAYTYPSDRPLKENIQSTSGLGLNFINKLQTVSYSYISDKTHVRHDGFIAQDIESIMKELKIEFSGLKKSEDGVYSLAYSDFVMPLVNAAKELKQKSDAQAREIDELKSQNAAFAKQVARMSDLEKKMEALAKMVAGKQ